MHNFISTCLIMWIKIMFAAVVLLVVVSTCTGQIYTTGGTVYCRDQYTPYYCQRNKHSCSTMRWMRERCARTCGCPSVTTSYYQWSPWTQWSYCDKSCSGGTMQRRRMCPGSINRCAGVSVETKACNTHPCHDWKQWGEWSSCSVTCGGKGIRHRTRECFTGDNSLCNGNSYETEQCGNTACQLPTYLPWSDWSACPVTCGEGIQYRTRECSTGRREDCPEDTYQSQKCGLVACPDCKDLSRDCRRYQEMEYCIYEMPWMRENCEKTCGFCDRALVPVIPTIPAMQWGDWSTCSVSCGTGFQTRVATNCVDPSSCQTQSMKCDVGSCPVIVEPTQWGEWSICSTTCGAGVQVRIATNCNGQDNCPTENRACDSGPCKGIWLLWSSWSECTTSCGPGTHFRFRACANNDDTCVGESQDSQECKENKPCNSEWLQWSQWGMCSVTCGSGTQKRFRSCMSGDELCVGDSAEVKMCDDMLPCEGEWLEWSEWSTCSATCGSGKQLRFRECTNEGTCAGEPVERRNCFGIEPCQDMYMPWGTWSECSVTCGQGETIRVKICRIGLSCKDPVIEAKDCFKPTCPVDNEPIWSSWSDCTKPCGGGTRTRISISCPVEELMTCPMQVEDCNNNACEPEYSQWGVWSECSKTCGTGMKFRTRNCNHGDCDEELREGVTCKESECPPEYTEWGDWSACSSTCGEGMKVRNRYCIRGVCNDALKESVTCKEMECPDEYGEWSQWSSCTASCGGGTKFRTRTCINGDCPLLVDSYTCNTMECPPEYSAWGSWSSCSKTCDFGITFRSRNCIRGECVESLIENKPCRVMVCPQEQYTQWSEWSECSASCGDGIVIRKRDCVGSVICTQELLEKMPCKAQDCLAEYTPWSSWTSCSQTCGEGTKVRTRGCDLEKCPGALKDVTKCYLGICPPEYSQWSEWGSCSASCGIGKRLRSRECLSEICDQLLSEMQDCTSGPCVEDKMTMWSEWSACSTTCEKGIKYRVRECNVGVCNEELFERISCYGPPCKKEYSQWGMWTTCSESCGNGTTSRSRVCNHGNCEESLVEEKTCNIRSCDGFATWSAWSECSVTCGQGIEMRKQVCNGEICERLFEETRPCSKDECPAWSEWYAWSDCSEECGQGEQVRVRECLNGEEGDCPGTADEIRDCNLEDCVIEECEDKFPEYCETTTKSCNDPMMSTICKKTCDLCVATECDCEEWGNWSECTKSCGGGRKYRNRECSTNSTECHDNQFEYCNTDECKEEEICLGGEERYGSEAKECCEIDIEETCGNNIQLQRIVGGEESIEGRWPWAVMITMQDSNVMCAGTLINSKWVLTAAHCVSYAKASDIILTMGTISRENEGEFVQRRRASRTIIHPRFFMPMNDIALIEVNERFFEDGYVSSICLPNKEVTKTGKTCFAAGWGMYNNSIEEASDVLREVKLKTYDLEKCQTGYQGKTFGAYISENMICAGAKGGKDTCRGDSGAALMCQRCSSCSWYVAGVTSFGATECGREDMPGVYTKISAYEEWIRKYVEIDDRKQNFAEGNSHC